jgi:hypothetical protein
MLLDLNTKYGLNDVNESILDDEIIEVGMTALNEAQHLLSGAVRM